MIRALRSGLVIILTAVIVILFVAIVGPFLFFYRVIGGPVGGPTPAKDKP